MKCKWTYEGNKSFRQILIISLGETLSGEILVGRNYSSGEIFVTFKRIRHFHPTKFRPIRYIELIRQMSSLCSITALHWTGPKILKFIHWNWKLYEIIVSISRNKMYFDLAEVYDKNYSFNEWYILWIFQYSEWIADSDLDEGQNWRVNHCKKGTSTGGVLEVAVSQHCL